MALYRSKRDAARRGVTSKYTILGFISSGTYGRVYKAQEPSTSSGSGSRKRPPQPGTIYAIKKFKPDTNSAAAAAAAATQAANVNAGGKDDGMGMGMVAMGYSGISQSAIREIALNREIKHENVVALREVILEDKSIHMVFEYAEHDFLQLIHHHSQTLRVPLGTALLKTLTFQLLNGLVYLHECHIMHRDLKPANILITGAGVVKIGDLGLARLTCAPLQPLVAGDKVVVTIWYRAPELLMGAKHYGMAVDCWAIGCVIAELASLRPIFKGEEAKVGDQAAHTTGHGKKHAHGHSNGLPFQRDQVVKIIEVLGTPYEKDWPALVEMPEYPSLKRIDQLPNRLEEWCQTRIRSPHGYDLLKALFRYDPDRRVKARDALGHRWFSEEPVPEANVFQTIPDSQMPPQRRVTQDEGPSSMMPAPTQPNTNNNPSFSQTGHGHGGGRKRAKIG